MIVQDPSRKSIDFQIELFRITRVLASHYHHHLGYFLLATWEDLFEMLKRTFVQCEYPDIWVLLPRFLTSFIFTCTILIMTSSDPTMEVKNKIYVTCSVDGNGFKLSEFLKEYK